MPSENKTANFGLNQWKANEYPKREDFNADNLAIDEALGGKLSKTGEGKDVTVNFDEATTRENIVTGEPLKVILGKVSKFFRDLKTVAFTGSYNNLDDKPNDENLDVCEDTKAVLGLTQPEPKIKDAFKAVVPVNICAETIESSKTWVAPSNVKNNLVHVMCCGGGGGGSGYNADRNGGGGGYISEADITIIPGNNYAIIIGAGGEGGDGSSTNESFGKNGGTTSFGDSLVIANGGNGANKDKGGDGGSGGGSTYGHGGNGGQFGGGGAGGSSGYGGNGGQFGGGGGGSAEGGNGGQFGGKGGAYGIDGTHGTKSVIGYSSKYDHIYATITGKKLYYEYSASGGTAILSADSKSNGGGSGGYGGNGGSYGGGGGGYLGNGGGYCGGGGGYFTDGADGSYGGSGYSGGGGGFGKWGNGGSGATSSSWPGNTGGNGRSGVCVLIYEVQNG